MLCASQIGVSYGGLSPLRGRGRKNWVSFCIFHLCALYSRGSVLCKAILCIVMYSVMDLFCNLRRCFVRRNARLMRGRSRSRWFCICVLLRVVMLVSGTWRGNWSTVSRCGR